MGKLLPRLRLVCQHSVAGQPIGRSKAETLTELTPGVLLDGIDRLQTQVATCRDGGENRPWLPASCPGGGGAVEDGGALGMTTPRARFGDNLRVTPVVVE